MSTSTLVFELTPRRCLQPLINAPAGPSSSLPQQRPLWALKGSRGATRQSSATTAVITNHVWEGARGRSSDLSGFRRDGHRSYGNFRPRGMAPSETPYRATGTIHFLAPDFGVAAAFGLSNNVAPGFSYNSGRTTGGVD